MFIFFCILLRITEGIGSAMFSTATFTVLPILFPNSVGTVVVRGEGGGGGGGLFYIVIIIVFIFIVSV